MVHSGDGGWSAEDRRVVCGHPKGGCRPKGLEPPEQAQGLSLLRSPAPRLEEAGALGSSPGNRHRRPEQHSLTS